MAVIGQHFFECEVRLFISIDHKSDWAVIREIDAANGVSYGCK